MTNELVRSALREVRYETTTVGDMVTVKAFLPEGFTMREFTLMFNLKDVRETDNFDQYIKDLMFAKLIERIPNAEKRGLSIPETAG
jgi:hypothetical protein